MLTAVSEYDNDKHDNRNRERKKNQPFKIYHQWHFNTETDNCGSAKNKEGDEGLLHRNDAEYQRKSTYELYSCIKSVDSRTTANY